jgi:hypothetical protein
VQVVTLVVVAVQVDTAQLIHSQSAQALQLQSVEAEQAAQVQSALMA